MIRIGGKVRYIGEDTVVYEPRHLYEVVGHDAVLGLYEVMSEVGVAYMMARELFEEVGDMETADDTAVQELSEDILNANREAYEKLVG